MRRHIFSLLMLFMTFVAVASSRYPAMPDDKADRAKWMQDMQQAQNTFLAKELNLTDKQRADFLPLYNKMRKEIIDAANSARQKAKEVKDKGDSATDNDYDSATKAYLDFKAKEAEIVKAYYKKFSHILSKRQLYRLESSERKFDRMLMQHRGGAGKKNKDTDKGHNKNKKKDRR